MGEKAVGRLRNDGEARVGTGVPGLDEMLEGGFPAGSLVTLAGRPGTGKTIFASQFLYQGARDVQEPGMYVSMLRAERRTFATWPGWASISFPSRRKACSDSSRCRR